MAMHLWRRGVPRALLRAVHSVNISLVVVPSPNISLVVPSP
jgi:hypothetical protein